MTNAAGLLALGVLAAALASGGPWAVVYLCVFLLLCIPGLPLGFRLFGRDHAVGWIAGALVVGGGAMGVFEATRFANGRKNAIRIEVNGSRGSLAFDFEDMNVLHFFDGDDSAATAGFRRILATEADHPYVAAWWPPGHLLGYEHGFTHQVVDLVSDIAKGADPSPSFADGLQVQRVLAAVEASSQSSSWQDIPA